MSDACARYRLTTEELLSWQAQIDRNGLKGLRTTRIQEYRGGGRRTGVHVGRGGRYSLRTGLSPCFEVPGLRGPIVGGILPMYLDLSGLSHVV